MTDLSERTSLADRAGAPEIASATPPHLSLRTRLWAGRLGREIGLALSSGVISVIVAIAALRITPTILGQRWQVGTDDTILHYLLFTSATQQFSYADNHDLGFPHGLNVFFSGQVDVSSALVMSLMALVIHNGVLMLNVFWLLGFVGTGVTGYAFFRALRIRPWLSILFGVLFSLAPYHFIRVGYGHPFIANYWAIALVGILCLVAAGPATDPFAAWAARATTPKRVLVRRILPSALLGLLVATTGGYYFVFGVIVVGGVWAFTALRTLVRRDSWRSFLAPTAAFVPLAFFVLVELFLLGRGYGERFAPYFASRLPGESELYAGKLLSLLAPWQGSLLPVLGQAGRSYANLSPIVRTSEAPGTPFIASVGLILLATALITTLVAGHGAPTGESGLRATWFGRVVDDARVRMLVVALVWTFLFYIVSGFGIVVAVVIGPEIRAWSRLSIVLILLGLAFVAILVESMTARSGLRFVVVGLIVVVAFVDQIAGVHRVTELNPTSDASLSSFVSRADRLLPDGCGVAQLPVKAFPDSGAIGLMGDYDEALPYLRTKSGDLRWSYGSIPGTKGWEVWQHATTPEGFAHAVASTHACAIEVDRRAYIPDRHGWVASVVESIGTDIPTLQSPDKRYLLFLVPDRS
ncbi:MAG: hypothetical protein JWP75_1327 [Frondihabitans sp.]|nr:hypothetical protein [Frondihabitans sp.]